MDMVGCDIRIFSFRGETGSGSNGGETNGGRAAMPGSRAEIAGP